MTEKGIPRITGIQVDEFSYQLENMGTDYNGFNLVYKPGSKATVTNYVIRIYTTLGITGEFVGWGTVEPAPIRMFAHYLIGKNAMERERIYSDVKRALRQVARLGLAPVDNALWDIAGKYYNAPLYQLLGGHKRPLPAYASTFHGDHEKGSGLDTPEGFADFAEECLAMGYPAFKIHGWGADTPLEPQVEVVRAVGKRVGGKMALVHPKVRGLMPPVFKNGYRDDLDAVDRQGCVHVPEGPGLGVEIDWDFVKKHRIGGVEYK